MPYKDIKKQRAAQQAYYQRNKDKIARATKDRRMLIIRYIQEYKQNKGCFDCGIMYPYWILDFDHCRGTKVSDITAMTRTHSFDDVKLEMEKCDVVCANCHRDRTHDRMSKFSSDVTMPQ